MSSLSHQDYADAHDIARHWIGRHGRQAPERAARLAALNTAAGEPEAAALWAAVAAAARAILMGQSGDPKPRR
jgi:hypothetical protein